MYSTLSINNEFNDITFSVALIIKLYVKICPTNTANMLNNDVIINVNDHTFAGKLLIFSSKLYF